MQQNTFYRPDIDGMRAFAVLAVMIYHAFPLKLPGGFVGVDIFFVISGFLITGILLREQDNGSFSFCRFYARRIRRLFPALFCVLTAVLAFGWFCLFSDEYQRLAKHVFGGASFTANFFYWSEAGYWDVSRDVKPLLHLWSLGIEEQFYIVFPMLLFLAWKKKLRLLTFLLVVLLASFALNISFYKRHPVLDFYAPFTRFWELLCGGVLACLFHKHQLKASPYLMRLDALLAKTFSEKSIENDGRCVRNTLSVLGLGLLLGAIFSTVGDKDFPGFRALLPVIGTAFLVAAGPSAWINRFIFSRPWVVGIGLISYPLYLWHWPLLSYAAILDGAFTGTWEYRGIRVGCLLISFLLALLTYQFVEKPIRFAKTQRAFKTGIIACLVACVGLAGLAVYLKDGLPARMAKMELIQKQFEQYTDSDEAGVAYAPALKEAGGGCRFTDVGAKRTVALLGDSHVRVIYPAIAAYNTANSLNTVAFAHYSVKFRNEKLLKTIYDILKTKTDITDVFIIYRNFLYRFGYDIDEHPDFKYALGDKYEPFLQGMIDKIVSMGKKIYLVSENPVFSEDPRNFVSRPFSLKQVYREQLPVMPLADVREHQKESLEMLGRLKMPLLFIPLMAFARMGNAPCFLRKVFHCILIMTIYPMRAIGFWWNGCLLRIWRKLLLGHESLLCFWRQVA